MVVLLVLGLALVACKSQQPETEQPSAPQAQGAEQPALSYKAKTYTNSQYGFSIKYPEDWVERPEIVSGTIIAVFGVPGFIPGVSLSVRDADAPLTADWIVAANTAEGNTEVVVTSDLKETTLFDGTPAIAYTSSFTSGQYDIVSYATSVDKNGKRIRATVWTIDAFAPYDEAQFSEIARTLSVK
ncbi:MAG: hypothetical protein JXB43_10135 [Dehalococcoidia bacterium]|nr:hypothetical protein [Dehalococcoidia bacterium]